MADTVDAEYACIVPFPDESASFANGFEAGMIWVRMEAGEQRIEFISMPLHAGNAEVFRRMAAARGYDLTIDADDGEWICGEFTKRRSSLTVISGGLS